MLGASIFKHTLFFIIFESIISVGSSSSSCVGLGQLCTEDCDCCGNDLDPSIQCERRNNFNACYISRSIGMACSNDAECKSQNCVNEKCTFKTQVKKDLPYCSLTSNHDYVVPVLGDIINDEGCPCSDPSGPGYEDAVKAFDGDLSTVYVNNWALGSGLEVKPTHNAPLRKMTICSTDDCPECDPTCYRIEGKCSDNTYTPIQQGPISFTNRHQCVDIPMNRPFYQAYRVTFPCQRGGFEECKEEPCTCPSAPVFQPSVPTPLPNSEETQRAGRLKFLKMEYDEDAGFTTLIYQYKNKNYDYVNPGFKDLTYAILQWEGNCCFDCYDTYMDDEDEIFNPVKDEKCFPECPDKTMVRSDDPNLNMQGIKLENVYIYGSHMYYFVLKVKGQVSSMKMLPYGIYSGRRYKEYDVVESPVCPMTPACNSKAPECKNYPMKFSELTLSGKCNEFGSESGVAGSSLVRRLAQKGEDYMC